MKIEAKVRGLVKDTDRHDNDRYYFRRAGQPKIRIRSPVGTDAFREEVRCAELGIPFTGAHTVAPKRTSPLAKAGSLKWLFLEYLRRAGGQWTLETRERKDRMLVDIANGTSLSASGIPNGDLPYLGMQLKHVAQLRDEKTDVPTAGNRRVKEISAVFNWAIGAGLATINPAEKCPKIKVSGTGHHTWTVEEIRQYLARHPPGTMADRWLRVLLFTGLRKADAIQLGRQHIYKTADGLLRIRITPGKTQSSSAVVVDIPLLSPLKPTLEQTPADQLLFFCTGTGKPYSEGTIGNYMRAWCNQAKLPHCSSHGLRKAGAVIAAEDGATSLQLQAVFGWTTSEQSDHYTRAASRAKLATEGAQHLKLIE